MGNKLNRPIAFLSCWADIRALLGWGEDLHGTCHGDAGALSEALACLRPLDLQVLWGLVVSSSAATLLSGSVPALRLRYRDTVLFGSELPVAITLCLRSERCKVQRLDFTFRSCSPFTTSLAAQAFNACSSKDSGFQGREGLLRGLVSRMLDAFWCSSLLSRVFVSPAA